MRALYDRDQNVKASLRRGAFLYSGQYSLKCGQCDKADKWILLPQVLKFPFTAILKVSTSIHQSSGAVERHNPHD